MSSTTPCQLNKALILVGLPASSSKLELVLLHYLVDSISGNQSTQSLLGLRVQALLTMSGIAISGNFTMYGFFLPPNTREKKMLSDAAGIEPGPAAWKLSGPKLYKKTWRSISGEVSAQLEINEA